MTKDATGQLDLAALRKEAIQGVTPFVLLYDGDSYDLPPPAEIDVESLATWAEAFNAGGADPASITIGLRALLGDRYEEFKKYRVTTKEAAAIFEAWSAHYGLTTGESSASSL